MTQNTIQDSVPIDLRSIASDIDFRRYLDVVNSDSQRTRAVVFVLVAALLLILTAYRNTGFPDWTDARLGRLQHAARCLDGNLNDSDCDKSKEYAEQFLQTPPNNQFGHLTEPELRLELREQINAFIKQRTDELSLHLPFFGIAIDMNDLGLLSGLLLIAILFVLYANLKSETDDLKIAWRKAWEFDPQKREDSLKLLLMAQVLASPAKSRVGLGVGQGLYVLYVLAPLLHIWVVRLDFMTYDVAEILEGPKWSGIDTGIDVAAAVLVIICSIFCIVQQRKLHCTLDDLIQQKDPRESVKVAD